MVRKNTFREKAIVILLISIFALLLFANGKNSITGNAITTEGSVSIYILPPGVCNIEMDDYWNFISLCADPYNKSIDSVLAGVDYRYVMRWNATTQEWEIYSPRASSNPFDSFEMNRSYFIYLNSPDNLTVNGVILNENMSIGLVQYWNAPSWPYNFTTNISKQAKSVNETLRYEMKWNATTQEWEIYSPKAADNEITTISEGEGKMIYNTNSSATLIYNLSEL